MSDQPENYRDQVASWPQCSWDDGPGAEALVRYCAATGWEAASQGVALIHDERWWMNAYITSGIGGGMALVLEKLRQVDPAAADEVARQVWLLAETGEWGEALYEFVDGLGIDAERVAKERSAVIADMLATDPRPMRGLEPETKADRWRRTIERVVPSGTIEEVDGELRIYTGLSEVDGEIVDWDLA